jgi:hypothetical protein
MFRISGTEFGIDQAKSRYRLRTLKSGGAVLDAEIYGDKTQYEKVAGDENSPWSWTLYPPYFYLRSFPAKAGRTAGTYRAKVSIDDLDEYEVAIYLIEHNDVDDVAVKADREMIQARGTVFLSGKPHPFSIKFTKQ